MLGEDTINHVIAETNKVAREKFSGNEIWLQQWCYILFNMA